MKLVQPLKREPSGGTATLTIRSSSIESFDLLLPFDRGSPPAVGGGFGSVALSIPLGLLGLMFGRPGPPLSRAISSRCAATVRRNSETSSNSFTTKLFRAACESPSRSAGGNIPTVNPTRDLLGIVYSYRRHKFCRSYEIPWAAEQGNEFAGTGKSFAKISECTELEQRIRELAPEATGVCTSGQSRAPASRAEQRELPAAATVTRSPRRICIKRGDRFHPLQRAALAMEAEAGDLLRHPPSHGPRARVGNDETQLAQPPCAPPPPDHFHPFGWRRHGGHPNLGHWAK